MIRFLKVLTILLGLLVLQSGVIAQEGAVDASTLYSRCSGNDEGWTLWCLGYVGGTSDALIFFSSGKVPKACLPENGTHGQTQAIVTKYLRDHPEYLNRPALEVVISALAAAFPCR